MLLENKNAVIYGAGGAVGGAVARAFAREGAKVFLCGRTLEPLDLVAHDITSTGGAAQTAVVDAFDQVAVEKHLADMLKQVGEIDISFNLVGMGGAQGTPVIEMSQQSFDLPIMNAMTAHFVTATAAARHMIQQRSGVILALTAQAGRKPYPDVGGFGVACAAIEGWCRQLACELGPMGVRVVCLRSDGSPDTPGVDEVFHEHAKNAGITRDEFEATIAERTLLKRLPKLAEVANVAVLVASDYASPMTGAIANVTCGEIAD